MKECNKETFLREIIFPGGNCRMSVKCVRSLTISSVIRVCWLSVGPSFLFSPSIRLKMGKASGGNSTRAGGKEEEDRLFFLKLTHAHVQEICCPPLFSEAISFPVRKREIVFSVLLFLEKKRTATCRFLRQRKDREAS